SSSMGDSAGSISGARLRNTCRSRRPIGAPDACSDLRLWLENQKKNREECDGRAGRILPGFLDGLEGLNVLSLPALGPFDHVELDGLAFLERTEAVALDGGVVDEDVLAVRPREKSKALGIVKPFHCSLFHMCTFPFKCGCIAELRCGMVCESSDVQNRQDDQVRFDDQPQCTMTRHSPRRPRACDSRGTEDQQRSVCWRQTALACGSVFYL